MAEEQKKAGRPSLFSEELAAEICGKIAEGKSLRAICKEDGMPSCASVFKWLKENKGFSEQYASAREAQADALADEIIEISDDGRNDWMQANAGDDAGWRANGENVQRSRLRVDARKWFASKVAPRKYGDKQHVEHSGALTLAELVTASMKPPEGEEPGQG